MNKDVDRPQSVGHFLNDPADLMIVREVSQRADCPDAVLLADFASGICQCRSFAVLSRTVLAHSMNTDIATEIRQGLGERTPKPSPRARDKCRFSSQ